MNSYLILYVLAPTKYDRSHPEETVREWKLYMLKKGDDALDAIERSGITKGIPGIEKIATIPYSALSIWERSGWRLPEETDE